MSKHIHIHLGGSRGKAATRDYGVTSYKGFTVEELGSGSYKVKKNGVLIFSVKNSSFEEVKGMIDVSGGPRTGDSAGTARNWEVKNPDGTTTINRVSINYKGFHIGNFNGPNPGDDYIFGPLTHRPGIYRQYAATVEEAKRKIDVLQ